MDIRECLKCKKKYRPLKANQKYCPVCKAKGDRRRVLHTVVCPTCGKSTDTLLYNRVYCSKECRERAAMDPTRMKEKKCPECGILFNTTRANELYCGPECAKKVKYRKDREWRNKHATPVIPRK